MVSIDMITTPERMGSRARGPQVVERVVSGVTIREAELHTPWERAFPARIEIENPIAVAREGRVPDGCAPLAPRLSPVHRYGISPGSGGGRWGGTGCRQESSGVSWVVPVPSASLIGTTKRPMRQS